MDLKSMSVEEILNIPFVSYHKPLEIARTLGRGGKSDERKKAIELLEGLMDENHYPDAIAPRQEYVLVLMEEGRHDDARARLERFEKDFPDLDEETLCRWGRFFKDQGDRHDALPWTANDGRVVNAELAAKYYRMSLEKYDKAYQIRFHYYPGINKATLLLILAKLGSGPSQGTEMRESAELAEALLKTRSQWPAEQPDDATIWHPATAGEAYLLTKQFPEAEAQYHEAIRPKNLSARDRQSMQRQVERIVDCFRKLGITDLGPFDDSASIFQPETAIPSQGSPS